MKKRISIPFVFAIVLSLLFSVLSVEAFAESEIMSVYASDCIPTGSVRMTAHRGFSQIAPENTLPAFRLAGEYGFWGAECDISPTADGVWVVMHDDTVDRTTDGEGKIAELTFDEISNLTIDFGNHVESYPNTKVPLLTEYLDVCREYGMHPVIEIKTCSGVEKLDSLAALLLSREEKETFVVISFGRDICARIKQLMPETPVYLIQSGDLNEDFDSSVRFCADNGLDGLDFCYNWDEAHIKSVQEAGLKSMVWTVDRIDIAEELYKAGVRDFTTNCLTPTKPKGSLFQRLRWKLRDIFYYIQVALESIFKHKPCASN